MDIEKAFDSLDHIFLIQVLKKYGFGKKFIRWIETITNKQESCVINGGNTTQYFNLEKGARQGDPISAYLFIMALEVLFILIKNNASVEGLKIFDHTFLYSAYADDTTFFVKNVESVQEIIKVFNLFSKFSGLKPNVTKCEVSGIGVLKGVQMAVCGMKYINLKVDSIKILGIHFSYNELIAREKNFLRAISNIQGVLKLWRMRHLTTEGRIVIFKTLAISKIVYLALLTNTPNIIIDELEKIQKKFIWNNLTPKVKHETLRMDYKNGGLKNVDIRMKIASLQCSWIKRLYDNNFHTWKIIPNYLISKTFGNMFKFHPNLNFKKDILKQFPTFYRSVFNNWKTYFFNTPEIPSCILSEFLWFNQHIKINNESVYFTHFSEHDINFVYQLFDKNGTVKKWDIIQAEYKLDKCFHFQWCQLIYALPESWKKSIKLSKNSNNILLCNDHHITRKARMITVDKLTAKEIYINLISMTNCKPSSQIYFDNLFQKNVSACWDQIYILPRKVTVYSYMRYFQYKIINNILFLNKKLHIFGISETPLCSFCDTSDETTCHIFFECCKSQSLWTELRNYFLDDFSLPILSPQTALFGFLDFSEHEDLMLFNHILLVFKLYIYKSREEKTLHLKMLLSNIGDVKRIEKTIATSEKKMDKYKQKWRKTDHKISI